MRFTRRLLRCEKGQDTVEYALLAAFIAVVCTFGLVNYRHKLPRAYNWVAKALVQAVAAQPGGGGRGGGTPQD